MINHVLIEIVLIKIKVLKELLENEKVYFFKSQIFCCIQFIWININISI